MHINKRTLKRATLLFTVTAALMLLLSACAQPAAVSHDNTCKFGYAAEREDGLIEHCTYKTVSARRTFTSLFDLPQYYFAGEGVFETKLYFEGDGNYRYETVLEFDGVVVFTENTVADDDDKDSAPFKNTVTGISTFKMAESRFTPVSSRKTYVNALVNMEDQSIRTAEFTFEADYTPDGNLLTAVSKVTGDEAVVSDKNAEFIYTDGKASGCNAAEYRLYDNEQFLLGIRVQTLDANFTDAIKLLNHHEALGFSWNIAASPITATDTATVTTPIAFTGSSNVLETDKEYTCIKIVSKMNSKNSGKDIVMYFTTDVGITYIDATGQARNNPTPVSVPIEFTQEGMQYTLTGYQNFARKVVA